MKPLLPTKSLFPKQLAIALLLSPFCVHVLAAPRNPNPLYINPAVGITMTLPEKITTVESSAITLAAFNVSINGEQVGNINLGVHQIATTREYCMRQVLASITSQNQEVDSKKLLQVDGHDAFLIESLGNLGGSDLHFLALYIIEKTRVFVVTCTAPLDKYKIAYPQFQAAIKSVKLGDIPNEKTDKPLYANPAYGISMRVPDVTPKRGTSAALGIFFTSSHGLPVGNLNILIHSARITPDECMKSATDAMTSGNLKVDATTREKVDGNDAILMESHGHLSGRDLQFLALYVIEKSQWFEFTCTAPEDKFKEALPGFQASLKSIRLSK